MVNIKSQLYSSRNTCSSVTPFIDQFGFLKWGCYALSVYKKKHTESLDSVRYFLESPDVYLICFSKILKNDYVRNEAFCALQTAVIIHV